MQSKQNLSYIALIRVFMIVDSLSIPSISFAVGEPLETMITTRWSPSTGNVTEGI